ncbi:MAG: hypothetical protein Q8930_20000 [Bacillota bacterium]|nr:hypothetical protein [Bacillota bacterium]
MSRYRYNRGCEQVGTDILFIIALFFLSCVGCGAGGFGGFGGSY